MLINWEGDSCFFKWDFKCTFANYALAIWYGARFISGKGYTGGQVLNVFDSKLLHEVASDLLFEGRSTSRTSPQTEEFSINQKYMQIDNSAQLDKGTFMDIAFIHLLILYLV